jgi:hypothetical protein
MDMSLPTLESIKMHCTLHNNVLDQHQSQLLLYCTHCDSVSNSIDAKKIILFSCILPIRTCKPRRLGVKNTILCVSHQKRKHLSSLCMLHPTLYISLFMFYTMPWNGKLLIPLWVNGDLETVHSWKQTTQSHTPHFTVYITHFTLQSIFLKSLLLMQTEQIFDGMHYLTKYTIMRV